jgi:hypothetical protein
VPKEEMELLLLRRFALVGDNLLGVSEVEGVVGKREEED